MRIVSSMKIIPFLFLFVILPNFVFAQTDEVQNNSGVTTIVEQVKLNFKEQMIRKGFFFDFPQHDFTFVIKPNGLRNPTEVSAKKISSDGMVFPEGYALIGNRVYEYEISDPMAFNHKIALEFTLRGNDFSKAVLHYWDFSQNAWVAFPTENQSVDAEGVLHGFAYATTLRLAVLNQVSVNWGEASWYKYKNCDCAASPFYPKGTQLLVTHLYNNKQVVVTVNDFGPERDVHPSRVIDLDYVAFKKIANTGAGVIDVHVELYKPELSEELLDDTMDVSSPESESDSESNSNL